MQPSCQVGLAIRHPYDWLFLSRMARTSDSFSADLRPGLISTPLLRSKKRAEAWMALATLDGPNPPARTQTCSAWVVWRLWKRVQSACLPVPPKAPLAWASCRQVREYFSRSVGQATPSASLGANVVLAQNTSSSKQKWELTIGPLFRWHKWSFHELPLSANKAIDVHDWGANWRCIITWPLH